MVVPLLSNENKVSVHGEDVETEGSASVNQGRGWKQLF